MGDSVASKKVLFIGAWRTPTVTDQLLRQIAHNIPSKKAFPTTLKLSSTGLELFIQDKKGNTIRQDQIPLENVVEFIDNRYNTKCTMAIERNRQEKVYTVFGFMCNSDRDAAEMLHSFRRFKNKLVGEGYNVDVTSRGQNWTLVTNDNTFVPNGQPQPNAPKQNGDVRLITNGNRNGNVVHLERIESGSKEEPQTRAEMKEELNHLADEVRDIKRIIQQSKERQQFEKHYHYTEAPTVAQTVVHTEPNDNFTLRRDMQSSMGRLQFEKHYNYRIIGPPSVKETTQTVRSVQQPFVHADVPKTVVVSSPPPTKRQTVYIKKNTPKNGNSKLKHVVAVSPSMKSQSLGRSTRVIQQRPSSSSMSTNTGYSVISRRVYDSANPYQEMRTTLPQNRNYTLVATNRTARFRAPSPVRKSVSYGSDMVQRNIEDVYRHGGRVHMMRRFIVTPPPVSPSVMDYVNVQSKQAPDTHTVPTMYDDVGRVEYVEDVVTDEPLQVRGVYENKDDVIEMNTSTLSNVSTTVNTSADDRLDDNVLMQGDDSRYTYTTETETPGIERDGNVIIVRASSDRSYQQQPEVTTTTRSTVINVGNGVENDEGYKEEHNSRGGPEIYHVKAESLHEYERHGDTNGMTVISTDERKYPRQDDYNDEVTRRVDSSIVHSSVIIMNGNEIHERERIEDDGLFGAYTGKPDEYDGNDVIVERKAYRYHDDDEEISNDSVHVVKASRTFESDAGPSNGNSGNGRESPNGDSPAVRRVHYDDEDHIIGRNDDDSDREDVVVVSKTSATHNAPSFNEELKQRVREKENKKPDSDDDEDERYQLDVEALRKSMEEPNLVIVENESNKQQRGGSSGLSGKLGKVAAVGGVAATAVVVGGTLGGVFNGGDEPSNDITMSQNLDDQTAPFAQDAHDAVVDFTEDSNLDDSVVPIANEFVYDGTDEGISSASNLGDHIRPLADDAINSEAVTSFAADSEFGSKALPVAKGVLEDGVDGDLPTVSGIGDDIAPVAQDVLETEAVTSFAADSEFGSKALPVAKNVLEDGVDGDLPTVSGIGDDIAPVAQDVLETEEVTSFAASSEFGSKAVPIANDVLENGINGDSPSVSDVARDALQTDVVTDAVAKSDIAEEAVPIAKRYLDEEAIKQITSRSEDSVLF